MWFWRGLGLVKEGLVISMRECLFPLVNAFSKTARFIVVLFELC